MGEEKENIKCIVVGNGGVGKSSMLVTYTTGNFPPYALFDDFRKDVQFRSQQCCLELLDPGTGGEDFEQLRPLFYVRIDVFIICFDLTCKSSYEALSTKWYPEVAEWCPNTPIILVGTKLDLRENEEFVKIMKERGNVPIMTPEGLEMCKEINAVKYFECSSLLYKGIHEIFDAVLHAAMIQRTLKDEVKNSCVLS